MPAKVHQEKDQLSQRLISPQVELEYFNMKTEEIQVEIEYNNRAVEEGSEESDKNTFVCEFDESSRAHAILVLKIDTKGKTNLVLLNRTDILNMTRKAGAETEEFLAKEGQTQVSTTGEAVTIEHPRRHLREPHLHDAKRAPALTTGQFGAFCDLQPVHMRDLRKLDHAFAVSNESSIVVRQQAILIHADPVRAIIMRDCCLIFVPDGADSLLSSIQKRFQECVQEKDWDAPYEFRALEAIFASIQLNYAREYEKIAQEVCDALDALANVKIASGELETLRVIKNDMNDFEAQVDGVRRALMELLDNEEDMRLLYLTKLNENPSLLFDLGSFDSEEVETILESYLKDIYSIRTSATLMQHRITTTESLVMMKLDYARNYLLALDMTLNLIAASLGFGMLVTGIFGMNLKIGIEDRTASAFWWVIFSVCGVCLFFILSGVFYFKHKGLLVTT